MAGNLVEVTWGRRCWSGLVVGKWGRGGSGLIDSEKSLIVTLWQCVGLGGLIENVLTRTAFSRRTGGWDLSHLQEIAVLAGYRSPRHAAGVRRLAPPEPSVALLWTGCCTWAMACASSVAPVRVAGHCRLREWTATHQG